MECLGIVKSAEIRFLVDLMVSADCKWVHVFLVKTTASRTLALAVEEHKSLCGTYVFLDTDHGLSANCLLVDLVKRRLNPQSNLESQVLSQALQHSNLIYLEPFVLHTCLQRLLRSVEWNITAVTASLRDFQRVINNFSVFNGGYTRHEEVSANL